MFRLSRWILLILLINFISIAGYAQNTVTIGGTDTRSDAVLWLVPNGDQGLILPVVNKNGFNPSTAGMMIYDPSDAKVHFWNGSSWVDVTQGGSGNYTLVVNGANLELQLDGSPVSTIPLSQFDDADNDPTNELQNLTEVLTNGNDAGGVQIKNLQNPTDAQDAATKSYVDGIVAVPILNLNDLQDVIAGTPGVGDVLTWNGTNWVNGPPAGGGDLLSTNNLSDLADIPTSRSNLGLGVLATQSTVGDAEITDLAPSKLLQEGAAVGEVLQWNGTTWVPVTLPGGGDLLSSNNLSDLGDITAARTNLGLGVLATQSTVGDGEITDVAPSKLLQDGAGVGEVLQWNGTTWVPVTLPGGGDLLAANNLADLADIPTARTNLGLGVLATQSTIGDGEITDVAPSKLLQDGAGVGEVLQWNGTTWVPVTLPGGGDLLAANNLSDLADIPTARTNLGLGVLATQSTIGDGEITDVAPSKLLQDGAGVGEVLQWNGTNWVPVTLPGGGDLLAANNLSDLADIPTARTNLGLGALATLGTVSDTEISDVDPVKFLQSGATPGQVLQWNGTNWVPVTLPVAGGDLLSINNLSDLADIPTARTNLGLGALAILNSVSDAEITNLAPSKLLQEGAGVGEVLQWNGTTWVPVTLPGGGDLLAANNLSDLADIPTARTNLGLGALAILGTVSDTEITDVDPVKFLQSGATPGQVLQWNGTNWVPVTLPGGGDLLAANNLSDLADIPTARTNLGLGALATLGTVSDTEITDVDPVKFLQSGATPGQVLQWNGTNWVPVTIAGGDLLAANNLSDLADIPTARTNLGLGALATANTVSDTEITDVAPSKLTQDGAALSDILQWNGTNWVPVALPGGGDLSSLSDANVTAPADGQILIYNSGGSQFENQTVSGDLTIAQDGTASVDGIGGSQLGTPPTLDGQALVFNTGLGQWDAGQVDINNGIAPIGAGRGILGSNGTTNSWVTGGTDEVLTTDAGGNLVFTPKSSFVDNTTQTGILVGNGTTITGVAAGAGVIFRGDGSTLVPSNIFDDGVNVGIGTATPASILEVVGSTRLDGNIISAGEIQSIAPNAASSAILNLRSNAGNRWYMTNDATSENFFISFENLNIANSEFMIDRVTRNIGIRTSTPRATVDIVATDAIIIPSGNNAERPGTPAAGMMRFNSEVPQFEGYDGASWNPLGGGASSLQSAYNGGSNILLDGGVNDIEIRSSLAVTMMYFDDLATSVGIGTSTPAASSALDVVATGRTALTATTDSNSGGDFAVSGIHTGTGDIAGFFWVSNPASAFHGVYGQADGSGAGLYGLNTNNGSAIYGQADGTGSVATLVGANGGNTSPVLLITNAGTGLGIDSQGDSYLGGIVTTVNDIVIQSDAPGTEGAQITMAYPNNLAGTEDINTFNVDIIDDAGTPKYRVFSKDGIGTTVVGLEISEQGELWFGGGPGSLGEVLTSQGPGLTPVWGPAGGGSGWNLSGNAGTTAGTDFIGTTDLQDLVISTNGTERLRIEGDGSSPDLITIPTQVGSELYFTSGGTNADITSDFTMNFQSLGGDISHNASNNLIQNAGGGIDIDAGDILTMDAVSDMDIRSSNAQIRLDAFNEILLQPSSGANVGIGTPIAANVSLEIARTDAIGIPFGTTAERPAGSTGYLRFNTDNTSFEGFDGVSWVSLAGLTGAANGLNVNGSNVELGGNLTGNTTIDLSTFSLNMDNGPINMTGTGLPGTYRTRITNVNGGGGSFIPADVGLNAIATGDLGDSKHGVQAFAGGTDGTKAGVYARAHGDGNNNYGIFGFSQDSPFNAHGVYGESGATGNQSYGVRGRASGAATNNYGVYGDANGGTNNWAGYFTGAFTFASQLVVGNNVQNTFTFEVQGTSNFVDEINVTGDPGSAGQILTSQGAGLAPVWTTSAASLINNTGTNNLFAGDNVNTGGQNNAIFGHTAGQNNTAINQTFVGFSAGLANTSGAENTFIGSLAGSSNTTGGFNTFVGKNAGAANVGSDLNTYLGFNTGINATGSGNTALGAQAGSNMSGDNNTFVGERSGEANTSGIDNTFLGKNSGLANITGNSLTLLGRNADVAVDGLFNAIAIGYDASVDVNNRMVLGRPGTSIQFDGALMPANDAGTSGQVLTSQGPGVTPIWSTVGIPTLQNAYDNGSSITMDGTNDILIESNIANPLLYIDETNEFVGIGTATPSDKLDVDGNINITLGNGVFIDNVRMFHTTGTGSTFLGRVTGLNNTAQNQTFIGDGAGENTTTGQENTFVGFNAGNFSTTGGFNVFVGRAAGLVNGAGDLNTFIGYSSGQSASGLANTFLGAQSGTNTTGNLNVFLGERTGQTNTTGTQNTFVGRRAGQTNATGSQLVLIGTDSDVGVDGLSNAVAIGYQATVSSSNSVVIGNTSNLQTDVNGNLFINANANNNDGLRLIAPAFGQGDFSLFGSAGAPDDPGDIRFRTNTGTELGRIWIRAGTEEMAFSVTSATSPRMLIDASGQVGIGTNTPDQRLSVNGNASKVGGGTWATFSDRRLKKDINPFTDGLDVLMGVKPVKFKYNGLGYYKDDGKEYIGVIAQDLKPIAPYMISSVSLDLDNKKTDVLQYDATAMTYILINSVQEQQKIIDDLKEQVNSLQAELNDEKSDKVSLDEKMNMLMEELAAIKSQLDENSKENESQVASNNETEE